MSAFTDWIMMQDADPFSLRLEDAFDAGRRSVIGKHKDTNVGAIFASMEKEAREAKIRLAGVLSMLRADGIISHSKMMQLSDMTNSEIAKAIDALKDNGEEESE